MASVIIYDETTGEVLHYLPKANTPDYSSRSDTLINPDISSLTLHQCYWTVDTGAVRDMTGAEVTARDAELAADGLASEVYEVDRMLDTISNSTTLTDKLKTILGL